MNYRKFVGLDWQVSALGMGCMRLPTTDGAMWSAEVDEQESIRMIRHAIDHGVNYLDTAAPYHGGNSEVVLGKALLDGYRDRVKIATKSPTWLIIAPEDYDNILAQQMEKLRTDHIDFYLFHALCDKFWENVILRHGLLARAEAAKRDGRIGHIGFSFHDGPEAFRKILDGYSGWEMCLLQYNYMDTENQAGTAGVKYAGEKGIPVVVMEPLLGGRLARPPKRVTDIFERSEKKLTPAEWALRWCWDQPEIATVLSGMNSMKEIDENLSSAARSDIGMMSAADHETIAAARRSFEERTEIPCTQCGYCMPCPSGVNIPENFKLYNECGMFDDPSSPRFYYGRFMPPPEKADQCIQCGECLEKCPQSIPISDWMPKVDTMLKAE